MKHYIVYYMRGKSVIATSPIEKGLDSKYVRNDCMDWQIFQWIWQISFSTENENKSQRETKNKLDSWYPK